MLELRDYQQDMIVQTGVALRAYRRVLLCAPTGSGKTALAAYMLGRYAERGKRSWFVVPRREILIQSALAFEQQGITPGIIAAGFYAEPHRLVQVCSMDSVRRRLLHVEHPDLLILDECHHVQARTHTEFVGELPQAKIVGLTATALRLDGKGFKTYFDALVQGPQIRWLMDRGYLCGYRAFSPPSPDVSDVHILAGDYNQEELAARMDQPKIVGDAIKHYQRLAAGKRALIFAVNTHHSKSLEAEALKAGIPCQHIDGTTPTPVRDQAIDDFRSGKLQMLTNCRLVEEGFNLPGIECVIDCAPTMSLSRVMQKWGRGMRPKDDGGKLIILDHANNIRQHGLPDEERTWELDYTRPKKKANAEAPVTLCKECFAAMPIQALVCPECGARVGGDDKPVVPEHAHGDLVEILAARQRRIEQGQAQTLDALRAFAKSKGYRSGWAEHVYRARQSKAGA